MSMMVSFVLSFFPRDVLDEILNLIESVSEDFPSYFCLLRHFYLLFFFFFFVFISTDTICFVFLEYGRILFIVQCYTIDN